MTNALQELLHVIDQIKCADIYKSVWGDNKQISAVLRVNHTPEEFEAFKQVLASINYDSGYGGQELYGDIWLKDGQSWMTRGEYDGSEWWETHKLPPIPKELEGEEPPYDEYMPDQCYFD